MHAARDTSLNSNYWWVRYYAEERIFKRTTKTEVKRDALEAAKRFYDDINLRMHGGMPFEGIPAEVNGAEVIMFRKVALLLKLGAVIGYGQRFNLSFLCGEIWELRNKIRLVKMNLLIDQWSHSVMKSYPTVVGSSRPTGYSHVVAATGSKMVFVAGQIALDGNGKLVGAGDMAAQAKQVYANIAGALAAAGATFADVVKLNTYIVDIDADRMTASRAARNIHFPGPNYPASTLIGVTALAMKGLMIEVEAVAIVE